MGSIVNTNEPVDDRGPAFPEQLPGAFQRITKIHARTLGVARVGIWRYNAGRTTIHCVALYDMPENHCSTGRELAAMDHPAYFEALAGPEIVAVNDVRTHPGTREFARTHLEPLGITSLMGVPIHLDGKVDGILCCEHAGPPREWTEDEMAVSTTVADLISLVLESREHRRMEHKMRKNRERLESLSRATNEALIRATDEKQLLDEICRLTVTTGGYRMAWIGYLRGTGKTHLEPMARAGAEEDYLSATLAEPDDEPENQEPSEHSMREGRTVVYPDLAGNGSSARWNGEALKRGYRSIICLPLRDGGRTFGMLGLYSSEAQQIERREIKSLEELADNIAFGIGNLRAHAQRQRMEGVVLKVAQAVTSVSSGEFFDLLTLNMVEALDAHGALVGRLSPDNKTASTLSFVLGGRLQENTTYGLSGTPCENVSGGNICIFESGVQQLFPSDHLLGFYHIESYAGIPLFDRSGRVAGIMVVFFSEAMEDTALVQSTLQIFSARAASEMDRQEAEARIREQASLLDKARDAILVRGLDHHLTYWNKGAERIYGWTSPEVRGLSEEKLLYRDTAAFHKACEQVLHTGEWIGELVQHDRQGRELTIEGRWTLLRDSSNQPASILAINTDVTEHKKLEQQFLRAQRLESIGTLAGGIAHDLNNVLAPVSMSLELLRADVHTDRGRELLDTLESSARRGADMVNQVLSFARGMAGRREEVHFKHLLHDIDKIIRDTFPKNITLETDINRDLRTIEADPTQLHQVLLNLCVNARDAMPGGGKILVKAGNLNPGEDSSMPESSPCICIQVEDQGSGIPPSVLDKIFEPFFTTKEVGKGTGLGLSTSMAIIRSHGGSIRAFSDGRNGTLFRILLPARHPHPESLRKTPEAPELPRGQGQTVLVVDDEEAIRQVAARILESFGYRVILASGGIEALDSYRIHREEIALVLTDMMMPGMDGTSTIRGLAGLDPGVRIVATSGIAIHGESALRTSPCVKAFLQKPFGAEALLQTLRSALAPS